MTRQTWHIQRDDAALTLARRLPAQFDFAVTTAISGGAGLRRSRIAMLVRQDMWRALQNLRGFSPVVRVAVRGVDLEITAGGQVTGQFPKARCEEILSAVMDDPKRRQRWVQNAQPKQRREVA